MLRVNSRVGYCDTKALGGYNKPNSTRKIKIETDGNTSFQGNRNLIALIKGDLFEKILVNAGN